MNKRVQMSRAICVVMLLLMTIVTCSPMVLANSGLNGVGNSDTTTTTTTTTVPSETVVNNGSEVGTQAPAVTTQPVTQ